MEAIQTARWRSPIIIEPSVRAILQMSFALDGLWSFSSSNKNLNPWCVYFHKQETSHCLNWGTIPVGKLQRLFMFFLRPKLSTAACDSMRRWHPNHASAFYRRRQAISWSNTGILLIGALGTNFNGILIEVHTFSFQKVHLKKIVWKMAAILSRPQCITRCKMRSCTADPTFGLYVSSRGHCHFYQ